MASVRTRFAPSPTGFLHVGGARTALFNYLFARRHGGTFVLRIEDTDRERSTQEYVDAILESLAWLELDHDEGPYFQSRRGDLYRRRVAELIDSGHAYWCFCSADEVEAKRQRAQAEGRKPVYDRTCRELGTTPRAGESAVVRFKQPLRGATVVDDMVRGRVAFDNTELDDLVIVRSDGTPTFHLVNVLDDIDMGITHILRGEDHLTNTPRQMGIFHALGVEPPRYGHLPLIVGTDRARLSKRHGATAVGAYRELGFLPDAVVNYLARLGWSHGDREIFTREELIEAFDIEGLGKSAAAFDLEKFTWVNAQHMKAKDDSQLAVAVRPYLAKLGLLGEPPPAEQLARVCALLKERAHTLVELAEQASYFFSDDVRYDAAAVKKVFSSEQRMHLSVLADELASLDHWTSEEIEKVFRRLADQLDIKLGLLAQPARVALTGRTASPGIFEVSEVLGKTDTTQRIRYASRRGGIRRIEQLPPDWPIKAGSARVTGPIASFVQYLQKVIELLGSDSILVERVQDLVTAVTFDGNDPLPVHEEKFEKLIAAAGGDWPIRLPLEERLLGGMRKDALAVHADIRSIEAEWRVLEALIGRGWRPVLMERDHGSADWRVERAGLEVIVDVKEKADPSAQHGLAANMLGALGLTPEANFLTHYRWTWELPINTRDRDVFGLIGAIKGELPGVQAFLRDPPSLGTPIRLSSSADYLFTGTAESVGSASFVFRREDRIVELAAQPGKPELGFWSPGSVDAGFSREYDTATEDLLQRVFGGLGIDKQARARPNTLFVVVWNVPFDLTPEFNTDWLRNFWRRFTAERGWSHAVLWPIGAFEASGAPWIMNPGAQAFLGSTVDSGTAG